MSEYPADYLEELGRIVVELARLEINLRYVYATMGSPESVRWDNIDDELDTAFISILKDDVEKRFKIWKAGLIPEGHQDLAGLLRQPPSKPDDKPKGFIETMELVQTAINSRNKIIHSVWLRGFAEAPETFDTKKLDLIRCRIGKVENHDTTLTGVAELKSVVDDIKTAAAAAQFLQEWILSFSSNRRQCSVLLAEIKEEMVKVYDQQIEQIATLQRYAQQLIPYFNDDKSGHGQEYDDQADDLKWFLYHGFIIPMSLAVRKTLEEKRSSVSLVNVLRMVKLLSSKITRSDYCQEYLNASDDLASLPEALKQHLWDQASAIFDEITLNEPELTESQIDKDIEDLKIACQPVRTVVNKYVAHSDKKFAGSMTHRQLDEAANKVKEIYRRYAILLGGPHLNENELAEQFSMAKPLANAFPSVTNYSSLRSP